MTKRLKNNQLGTFFVFLLVIIFGCKNDLENEKNSGNKRTNKISLEKKEDCFRIENSPLKEKDDNLIQNLENKKGIKNLILGSNFEDFKFCGDWNVVKNMTFTESCSCVEFEQNTVKKEILNSNNLKKAFKHNEYDFSGLRYERVELLFYKNKLIKISFSDSDDKFGDLLSTLKHQYGTPNEGQGIPEKYDLKRFGNDEVSIGYASNKNAPFNKLKNLDDFL